MEKRTDPEAIKRQFVAEPWSCPYCGEGRIHHKRGGPAGLAPNPSWMHCPDCKEQWLALYDNEGRPVGVNLTKIPTPQEKTDELKELLQKAEDLMGEVEGVVKDKYTEEHGQICGCGVCMALEEMRLLRADIIEVLAEGG